MPRGQPDYGIYQQQWAIAGMSDLGEAVARLDSINVFDRRGFTVWQDDFEAPSLRWHTTRTAPGELAVLSTATAFSGVQSVLLNVPAGVGAQSILVRRFPLIRLGKIGMEFWLQGFTKTIGYLQVGLYVYDGTTPNYAELRYDTNAQTLSIRTPAGFVPIATNVYMSSLYHYFLPIKLVIDMDNNIYTRLLIGETEYDLSAHALTNLPVVADRYVQATFTLVGSAADDMWMYLDNFILTQNEP